MANITLGGKPANTSGDLPTIGKTVTFSSLLKNDLTEVSSENYAGKIKVLSIFPSVDTGVCAASIRRFNKEAAQLKNTVVLNISMDLPFANVGSAEAKELLIARPFQLFAVILEKKWV